MSKNECKRCGECKHYERVNDNEPEDHGDCTLYPVWVDVWAAHYCGQWGAGNNEEPAALDIDWNQVPEGYGWVAQDSDGTVCAYSAEPITANLCWAIKPGQKFINIMNGIFDNPNWRNTLTKRPSGK